MKGFFQNLGNKMRLWMQGRYGQDELNQVLLWSALGLTLLGSILKVELFSVLAMPLLIWSLIRCYSRNIHRRREERAAWLRFWRKIRDFFALQKRRWTDRKTYKYFRCKNCGAVMRVPKGEGTLRITCRQCRREMTKRS